MKVKFKITIKSKPSGHKRECGKGLKDSILDIAKRVCDRCKMCKLMKLDAWWDDEMKASIAKRLWYEIYVERREIL